MQNNTIYPLPFASYDDLVAAFEAGTRFRLDADVTPSSDVYSISRTTTGICVQRDKDSAGTSWYSFKPDGSRPNGGARLMVVGDIKTSAPVETWPLPFKTFAELEAAFDAGTEFNVVTPGKCDRLRSIVTSPSAESGWRVNSYGQFRPDGSHPFDSWKIIAIGEIKRPSPAPQTVTTQQMWHPTPADAITTPFTSSEPFLKRVLAGEDFHCPKTGEKLLEVQFSKDHGLRTWLQSAEGRLRLSENYRHDGTHKHESERSLIPGLYLPPKPKTKEVKATIYRHAYNGTLFVIREGEVIPNIRGINNATKVGSTTITEPA